MIGKTELAVGLGRLSVAARSPLDEATVDVYHELLGPLTDPAEWEAFTKQAAAEGTFDGWFPKLHEIEPALCRWRTTRRPPPAGLLPGETCGACRGSGFEIVERDGREFAQRCACRRPQMEA